MQPNIIIEHIREREERREREQPLYLELPLPEPRPRPSEEAAEPARGIVEIQLWG